ncbi:MAG: OsmC family protein [Hyphomonadaceae bacterium]
METVVNGVSRAGLQDAIALMTAQPALAEFTFRIENEWIAGGLNRSRVTDFDGVGQTLTHAAAFEICNDEPAVLLSGDQGPNPVENLLHALAGCLTTSIVYHAAARGMRIDALRTRFSGDLDLRGLLGISTACRNGYRAIEVEFDIEGDLTSAQKRELIAMGPRYSPVFDVISHGTPVHCRLREDTNAAAA